MDDKEKTPPRGKRAEKKLDRLLAARSARDYAEQVLGIALRPLVMCGLPLRSTEAPHLHIRRCGEFVLEILGDPRYGAPYGQDRIIPIWLATVFVHLGCPEDNTVHFTYARDILRAFDLPVDGKSYQRLRERFLRFTYARFTFSRVVKKPNGKEIGIGIQHIPLLSRALLWHEDEPNVEGRDGWPNSITLDAQWADEIRKHPIPVDIQTVRALLDVPGALDLYQWQAWRCFSIQKQVKVPLEGDTGLIAQLGCVQDQPTREIRRTLRRWQKLIKLAWPGCQNHLSRDGQHFVLYPAKALSPKEKNSFLLRGLPRTPK